MARIVCLLLLLAGYSALGFAQPDNPAVVSGETKNLSAVKPELLLASNENNPVRSSPAPTKLTRSLTINNQCSFDVWMESVGSNASAIPCSPSKSSAQANCPTGLICYEKNVNTSYCVAGTATVTTYPVTSQSDITLVPASCPSGDVVTDTSSPSWGQCECSSNSNCAANQVCQNVSKGINQCFWGYSLPNNGKLAKTSGKAILTIAANSTKSDAMVASGKFYAKLACNKNGDCFSDNTKGAPATLIEYTFQNNNDWYDISYINGINLPVAMYPVPAANLNYQQGDPYRCMAAGGDKKTIAAILAYQKKNGITGNSKLQPFACTNNYSATFDTSTLSGFNFVSSASPSTACTTSKDCASGLTCGLTLKDVQQGGTGTTCGNRLGYWTYAQFCAANSSYDNAGLGVACGTAKNLAYALCEDQSGLKDKGPGKSCFNSSTTSAKENCCGYEAWALSKKVAQPMASGYKPVKGVVTTDWKKNILPAVKNIKEGCYLAYSYQYDDPYSTFTCATSGGGINQADYNITLCPNGDNAGINPPPPPPMPPACIPTVPSGYASNAFDVGIPKNTSIAVYTCDAKGNCTSPLSPASAGGSIYNATTGGTGQYKITATNAKKTKSACTFSIPAKGCITPVNPSQDCTTWVVAPDGAWQGRSISIPAP